LKFKNGGMNNNIRSKLITIGKSDRDGKGGKYIIPDSLKYISCQIQYQITKRLARISRISRIFLPDIFQNLYNLCENNKNVSILIEIFSFYRTICPFE